MKTSLIILAAMLLAVPTLRAQVVADGATATLSGVTNSFTGEVVVGTNGSFTQFTLSDNALLTNSANGVIGLNLTARSNEVRLISPTARWRMGGSLFVGSNGPMSRLVVSNGAFLDNNFGNLGNRVDSSNNFALVTGGGSMWSNRLDLRAGTGGSGNQLILSNGGWVVSRSGLVGNNVTSSNNFALVTGSGSVWSNAINLEVGSSGSGNRLAIEAGALAHCDAGTVGHFTIASDNEVMVTGPGSLWTNRSFLTVGDQGSFNRLVVDNGAAVWSGNGLIGSISTASNNQVLVTGAGSGWRNQNDLTVGNFGPGNRLVVSNGGTVSASNLFIGFTSLSVNNRVTVDGGTLRANNATGTGVLDVRRGTNVLNAGLIDVDRLVLTNAQGIFEFKGGTLLTRGASINGAMVVGPAGASPALWDVRPGAFDHAVTLSVVVGGISTGHQLLVRGGALLTNGVGAFIGRGAGADFNSASVSGAGSRWRTSGDFMLGSGFDVGFLGGAFNRLTVADGGWVGGTSGRLGTSSASSSNNVALVTGPGSVWTNAASVIVGEAAPGNQLQVRNGGAVVAAGGGVIGLDASASANTVFVSDAGSQWRMAGNLEVGRDGSFNDLVLSDGALVSDFDGIVGNSATASNNMAVVTGAGSLWSNSSSLSVGSFGAGNQLIVSDGGAVVASFGSLGDSSDNNQAMVTGSGSVWSNANNLSVGFFGAANRLQVRSGGLLVSDVSTVGVSRGSNEVILAGPGSVWSNRLDQTVGFSASRNQLLVSDGATALTGGNGIIGDTTGASSNVIVASGPGSRWLVTSNLLVGNRGAFNRLVVSNGGFFSSFVGFLGYEPTASNNIALVTGSGSVWSNSFGIAVGNLGRGNQLVVSNGGSVMTRFSGELGSGDGADNNLAMVTGAGSSWLNSGPLFVGLGGNANRLVVSNAGRVVNDTSVIGVSSRSNEVLVTGAGSLWSNRLDLLVGEFGSANRLLVNNSGTVFGSNVFVGFLPESTNNRVLVNGGTLRAANATGTSVLDVRRGTNVLNAGLVDVDALVLTNKGVIPNPTGFGNGGFVNIPDFTPLFGGYAIPYPSIITVAGLTGAITRVTVTLSNLSHTFPDDLDILLVSPAGQKVMLMSDAGGSGTLTDVRLTFDESAGMTLPDSATITPGTYLPTDYEPGETMDPPAPGGPYSTTLSSFNGSNPNGSWALYIYDDFGNSAGGGLVGWGIQITTEESPFADPGAFEFNGGTLVTRGASINNAVPFVVGGPGGVPAVWDVRAGVSDHFVASEVIVGSLPAASSNNLLHVTGGTLQAGVIDIRGGTNRLDSGLMDVDRLVITSTRGQFEFNSGTLRTINTTVANGRVFTAGNGVSAATFQLLGGTHTFSDNLVVASNASLIGNGTIDGIVTVSSGGRLIPGAPIGRINSTDTVILQGAVNLQIDKTGAAITNDQLAVAGAIFYGGALTVTDIGTDVLVAGDRFPLFSAAPFVGSFATITLPPLGPGLSWRNNLLVDGSIEVIAAAQPGFASISLSGTNVILAGTNGTPNATYTVLASTNVALPSSNWVSISTKQFDASGHFSFTNAIVPGIPQRFYQLRIP